MNEVSRGIRNAFRNRVRSLSIILILGLAIGLSLVMLIAHQAVNQKINQVKSTVGNTITISPAGFSNFSQANNALTTSQLNNLKSIDHLSTLSESLTDRLTTIGSTQPSFGGFGGQSSDSSNSNNQTSLTSPTTINTSGRGGSRFFVSGGGSSSLPTSFSPPITILGTSDPSSLDSTSLTLNSGITIDGTATKNVALISQSMADKNSLKAGSTFTAYSQTITVAGIYKNLTQGASNTVIVPLPTLQSLTSQSGDVTAATATVDSVDNLASVTSAVKAQLGTSADVTNSQDEADNTIKPLKNVETISLVSLIGAVIAGGIIIFLVMLMIVRERRREIGILKAIGAGNFKVMRQFMIESLTLTLLAAVVGIVIGTAAASPVTTTLVNNASSSSTTASPATAAGGAGRAGSGFRTGGFGGGGRFGAGGAGPTFATNGRGLGRVRSNITNVHAVVSWTVILYGLLAAAAIAVIGSSLSSYLIAKVRPAEAIRAE